MVAGRRLDSVPVAGKRCERRFCRGSGQYKASSGNVFGRSQPGVVTRRTALAVAAPVKSDELTNKGALYVVRVSDGSLFEVATNDDGFGGLAWHPAG